MTNFDFFSAVYIEDRPMNQPLDILFKQSISNKYRRKQYNSLMPVFSAKPIFQSHFLSSRSFF